MFDTTPFTDEELLLFAEYIRKINGLKFVKSDYDCVTNALGHVGSHRRRPICGNHAKNVKNMVKIVVCSNFTEEEVKLIVSYCMDENKQASITDMTDCCGKIVVDKLVHLVPIFMTRRRTLKDYLDD